MSAVDAAVTRAKYWLEEGVFLTNDDIDEVATDVLMLAHRLSRAEAALEWVATDSKQLVGMVDPFGSEGPPMLVGAGAYFAARAALDSGGES